MVVVRVVLAVAVVLLRLVHLLLVELRRAVRAVVPVAEEWVE